MRADNQRGPERNLVKGRRDVETFGLVNFGYNFGLSGRFALLWRGGLAWRLGLRRGLSGRFHWRIGLRRRLSRQFTQERRLGMRFRMQDRHWN